MIRYEYEVGGINFVGYMPQPREIAGDWSVSDTVSVL
jgi:hypothetical protein